MVVIVKAPGRKERDKHNFLSIVVLARLETLLAKLLPRQKSNAQHST